MGSAGTAVRTVAAGRVAVRAPPGDDARTAAARRRRCWSLAAIAFVLVAAHAAGERQRAVQSVAVTERLLVSAVELSVSLSNTHAIAAFGFLRGGPEQPASRRLYEDALQQSSVARGRPGARDRRRRRAAQPAVRRITRTLPIYSGLIENARANYRQGFPVGNAYLRKASKTMRDAMLPSARDLYEIEARNLTAATEPAYRPGCCSRSRSPARAAGGARRGRSCSSPARRGASSTPGWRSRPRCCSASRSGSASPSRCSTTRSSTRSGPARIRSSC